VVPIFGRQDAMGQPTAGSRCAVPACHSPSTNSQGLNLLAADNYDKIVNAHSTEVPKIFIVKPGSFKSSMLARKVLGGSAVIGGGVEMPNGCPRSGPSTGCLGPGQLYTLLAWIK